MKTVGEQLSYLTGIVEGMDEKLDSAIERIDDQDGKILSLNDSRSFSKGALWVVGTIAVLSGILGLGTAWAFTKVTGPALEVTRIEASHP